MTALYTPHRCTFPDRTPEGTIWQCDGCHAAYELKRRALGRYAYGSSADSGFHWKQVLEPEDLTIVRHELDLELEQRTPIDD